jgi:ribonuclease P protein component
VEAALSLMHVVPEAVQDSLSKKNAGAKFTSEHRLLCKSDFDRVIQAENISDQYVRVFFVANVKGNARLGLVTGKKFLPRAVDRNRTKRIIREAFRQHPIKFRNIDLVVMLRHGFIQKSGVRANSLENLFSLVENRCVDLLSN